MLRQAYVHRLHAGVYAVGHLAPVPLGRETAALLACNETAVLSHSSAAALWGIRPDPPESAPIEVTLRRGGVKNRRGIRAHSSRSMHRREIRLRHGLPVTSPARTLLDIAPDLSRRELERALDEALATHIMTKSQLTEVLERSQGRRGAAILKALAVDRTTSTRTRSHPEETFLRLIREARLPTPLLNVRVHGFEVDFYWPDQGVVVEIDGYRWHSTKSAFERDHRKDATLRAHGIDVNRFSADQLDDTPYAAVADVTRRLTQRTTATAAVWESTRRPSTPSPDGRGAAGR